MNTTKEATMDTTPTMDPFRVRIIPDDFPHDAPDEEGDPLFRLVSFGNRHNHYQDPRGVVECQFEYADPDDGYAYGPVCEQLPFSSVHNGETLVTEYETIPAHEFDPPDKPIVALLSYYEHGMGRWSRIGHGPPDHGGFDTVSFAGVLLLQTEDRSEIEWWNNLDADKRDDIVDSFLDEFNAWWNGEIYGIVVDREGGTCECCNRPYPREELASCWGFNFGHIGNWSGNEYRTDAIEELVSEAFYAAGIDEPDELVKGTHYVVVDE